MAIALNLNGETHNVDVSPDTPLLWVIRDELKLTGTKYGCGIAQCGACTVHIDGAAVRSCQMAVGDLEGAAVTTIEAVEGTVAEAVKQAWQELDVVMGGNACRCATYTRIRAAIHRAADILEG
jgi:isoquinoline 1-oxidoreductase alpha subunit